MTLIAEFGTYGWSVIDINGGRWWPYDDAQAEILSSSEPASVAIKMCNATPMRGRWHN